MYTDGLSEGLARALEKPDETRNLYELIERFSEVPRQDRLRHLADEASRFDSGFDDLTILLIEDSMAAIADTVAVQR